MKEEEQGAGETCTAASAALGPAAARGVEVRAGVPQTPPAAPGSAETTTSGASPAGSRASPLPAGQSTASVTAFRGIRVGTWDRYAIKDFLGQGGMGVVYRAFDPRLKRPVALKFIRQDDPELARRFLQEAQAQARVEHEHVCKVYEAGEVEGQLFIAMQLIEGRTLKDAYAQMTLEEKLRVMEQVSEGLHAAHRIGLVHRDMKPSNVMVAKTEDGRWWPYVMDFGLARDIDSHGETAVGAVLGTPAYMAIEQASGLIQNLDRRTDVYSIGATMYEVLTGRPPFEAPSPGALLIKVISEEPLPLRKLDPVVPVDVDTIVMKCLEKEQARRYDSARALADDIRRYLDGEPILARSASLLYRLRRRARKQKTLFAVIAVATVAIMIAAGLGVRTAWRARSHALLAQRFGSEAKEIEAIMRFSFLSPLHNTQRESGILKQRMERIERQMAAVGDIGLGPGHYALGRGYMALRDYTRAREHLELTSQHGYQDASVALALGQTYAALYQEGLEQIERVGDPDERSLKQKEIEAELRAPAVEHLRRARGAALESSSAVAGLLAFLEGRHDEALRMAARARQESVWEYEAIVLEGDTHRSLGSAKAGTGDYDGALEEYQSAMVAYREAARIGESDPHVYDRISGQLRTILTLRLYGVRGDAEADFRAAMEASRFAAQADPESAVPHTAAADGLCLWGNYLTDQGRNEEAIGVLQEAAEEARFAVRLDPRNEEAHSKLGLAMALRGSIEKNSGVDPRPSLDAAIDSLKKATSINPRSIGDYNILGLAYLDTGEYQMMHGGDPREALQQSIACYRKAFAVSPKYDAGHINISLAFFDLASYQQTRGIDPTDSIDGALAACAEAAAINPNDPYVYNNRGMTLVLLARHELDSGLDPRPTVERAITELVKSAELDPEDPTPPLETGKAYGCAAEYELLQGRDPSSLIEKASRSIEESRVLKPSGADTEAAAVWVCASEAEVESGRSPDLMVRRAIESAHRASQTNPGDFRSHTHAGRAHTLQASWLIKNHRPAEESLRASERSFEAALALNPNAWEACAGVAELCRWRAEEQIGEGRDAGEIIAAGMKAADQARSINPRAARAMFTKGILLLLAARTARTAHPGAPTGDTLRLARQALESSVKLNRNLAIRAEPHIRATGEGLR